MFRMGLFVPRVTFMIETRILTGRYSPGILLQSQIRVELWKGLCYLNIYICRVDTEKTRLILYFRDIIQQLHAFEPKDKNAMVLSTHVHENLHALHTLPHPVQSGTKEKPRQSKKKRAVH
jgi:hypothetical protein